MTEPAPRPVVAPPVTPRWAWSFLWIVATAVLGTVSIHLLRLPTGARGHYNRGVVDAREGRYESAIANLDRALELDPKMVTARVARAGVWYRAGKPFRALADANLALEAGPSARALYARGLAYQKLGRLDEAVRDFGAAIKDDKEFGKAALALGDVAIEAGRDDLALSAYRDAFRQRHLDETVAIAPLLIWEARTLLGDGAEADAELRGISGLDSSPNWFRGVRAEAAGDRATAIEQLRLACASSSWARERACGLLRSIALGFRVQPDDDEISSTFSFGPGTTVAWAREGTGLASGDRLLRIGDVDATPEAVEDLATHAPVGSTVSLELRRAGETMTVPITIGGPATPGSSAPTR